jgi:hypothetical protein
MRAAVMDHLIRQHTSGRRLADISAQSARQNKNRRAIPGSGSYSRHPARRAVRSAMFVGGLRSRNPEPVFTELAASSKPRIAICRANLVSDESIGFDSEQNEVTLVTRTGETIPIRRAAKRAIAGRIFDEILKLRLALHAERR